MEMGKPDSPLPDRTVPQEDFEGGQRTALVVSPMTALVGHFPGKRLRVLALTQVKGVALSKSLYTFWSLCFCAYAMCHFGPFESQDCVSFIIRCDLVSLGRLLNDFPLPSLLSIY